MSTYIMQIKVCSYVYKYIYIYCVQVYNLMNNSFLCLIDFIAAISVRINLYLLRFRYVSLQFDVNTTSKS